MRGEWMEFPNSHRWTELVLSEDGTGRIAFLMDGLDGNPPTEVPVTLTPEGSDTRLQQVMVFPSTADITVARSYDAEAKGQETLAKLAASLGE